MYIYHVVSSIENPSVSSIDLDVEIYNEDGTVNSKRQFSYPIGTSEDYIKEALYQFCSQMEKDDIIKAQEESKI